MIAGFMHTYVLRRFDVDVVFRLMIRIYDILPHLVMIILRKYYLVIIMDVIFGIINDYYLMIINNFH